MKSKILVAVLIGFSAITLSCSRTVSSQIGSIAKNVADPTLSDISTASTVFYSNDGTVQLTAPSSWQDVATQNSEPNLVLRVKSQFNQFQVGVQAFSKAKYPQITPKVAAEAASDSAKAVAGNASTIQQTALTQINKQPVVQYEARGEFGKHQIVAIATLIESPDAYYNLLAVGYAADYDTMHDEVNRVIQSFQNVQSKTTDQDP